MENEVWCDILGFEGYQISNLGRVKGLTRFRKSKPGVIARVPEKILHIKVDKYGYATVGLCKDGKVYWKTVHRLVATAFIPNPYNLKTVNHLDYNKLNNQVSNLEWCSVKDNVKYSRDIPVDQLDLKGNLIKKWDSATEASVGLSIDRHSIIRVCKHQKWYKTAGGFTFRYSQ